MKYYIYRQAKQPHTETIMENFFPDYQRVSKATNADIIFVPYNAIPKIKWKTKAHRYKHIAKFCVEEFSKTVYSDEEFANIQKMCESSDENSFRLGINLLIKSYNFYYKLPRLYVRKLKFKLPFYINTLLEHIVYEKIFQTGFRL